MSKHKKNWGSEESESDLAEIKELVTKEKVGRIDLSKLKSKLKLHDTREPEQIKRKRPPILEDQGQEDKDIVTTFTGSKYIFKQEEPRSFDTCLKFYYPDIRDFKDVTEGGLNFALAAVLTAC